ncbi:MAG TPA: SOS response-associated peptidase family protein [Pseudolabrys sp.]
MPASADSRACAAFLAAATARGETRAICGRFTQAYTWQELVAFYRLTAPASNLQPRYNIAPTTTIDAIIPRGADRLELTPMRWSLTPVLVEKDRQGKEVPSTFRHAIGMQGFETAKYARRPRDRRERNRGGRARLKKPRNPRRRSPHDPSRGRRDEHIYPPSLA